MIRFFTCQILPIDVVRVHIVSTAVDRAYCIQREYLSESNQNES